MEITDYDLDFKYLSENQKIKNMFRFITIGLCLVAIVLFSAFSLLNDEKRVLKSEVEETVLKAYIHGAFNELNPDAMAKGFHPDFAIFSAKGEEISKYPIAEWVEGVRKRKSSSDFDPANNVWNHKFAIVDITGGSAQVKVELSKDGRHIYTDYLSLLKFESGWKIVAKVYHKHTES